ncbi:MAG: diaminopimelate decarboxylase [Balneolaceae bacterium]|nr:diaminopimelate decarboxylase [Balneolaceae bacterium]
MFSPVLIEKFRDLETPFYYYDLDLLRKTLQEVKNHGIDRGFHVHYAIKANFHVELLNVIREYGLGIDCVSGPEIERAIESGFRPDQIAFAGVGKTDKEIRTGLQYDIYSFNCESLQELEVLNQLAGEEDRTANVSIRLNPNVEAKTHKYITTGLSENKFGIRMENLPEFFAAFPNLNHLKLTGIHFHIGSQITSLKPFYDLCEKIENVQQIFEREGHHLQHINAGGGLGINYEKPDEDPIPDFKAFFKVFEENLNLREGQELHFELGRSIVGQCGSLISKVLYIKEGIQTNFAVLDAGMTELIRPALYQAKHRVDPLTSDGPPVVYDVVGPICETSDTFRKGITVSELKRGDLVAIRSSGAYGEVMSSGFNLREKVRAYYSEDLLEEE